MLVILVRLHAAIIYCLSYCLFFTDVGQVDCDTDKEAMSQWTRTEKCGQEQIQGPRTA